MRVIILGIIGCLIGFLSAGIIPKGKSCTDIIISTVQENKETEKYKASEEEIQKYLHPDYWIDYRPDGAFLMYRKTREITGPYKYIEEVYDETQPRQFISDRGLLGYMSFDGSKIICDAKFTEAEAPLRFGTRVSESEGDGYYYISKDGRRITSSEYIDGSLYYEHQNWYCRVKLDNNDDSWAVIDREQKVFIQGYSKINPLPELSTAATGVKDGKAVVFFLDDEQQMEAWREIILEEYSDIEPFEYFDTYAVVTADNYKGVVNGRGETVIPPKYELIEILEFDSPCEYTNQSTFQYLIKAKTYKGNWDVFVNP